MRGFVRFSMGCGLITGILLSMATFSFAGDRYTFGVVPQQKATILKPKWDPLLKHINEKAGLNIEFVTTADIPEFKKKLDSGEFDFSYENPYQYVQASELAGYRAFATAKKKLQGIVVVRNDSAAKGLEDLAGKTVSFPQGAFAADLLLRAILKKDGIKVTEEFTRGHDDGFIAVARGTAEAAGGVMRTLKAANPQLQEKLKILWTSPNYSSHAFSAHPRVPADVVKKVQTIMLEISADPALLEMFKAMEIQDGVQAAQDSDWQDIRDLAPVLATVKEN